MDGAAGQVGRFLFVIWQSGGGTNPEIGLARMLSARGHAVRVLGPLPHRARVERAGCEWRPFPQEAEFDPSLGRALEDQEDFLMSTLFGMAVPEALFEEVGRERPDVLVVDYQLRSALSAAERARVPTAAVVHTAHRFHGVVADPDRVREVFDLLDETRSLLGVPALPVSEGVTPSLATIGRCERTLVVMPAEFDPWDQTPPNVVHVGPIFEEGERRDALDLPWPFGDPDPLVVVSMSSQYMHQESVLLRIADAVADLPARVLVTTGSELLPGELPLPESIAVRSYVPHLDVLPRASLVITHGGMGTLMAAFACGIPSVCIPLGRDQLGNAERAQELEAGIALAPDASEEAIRGAVREALASEELRAGAGRMRDVVDRYGAGAIAVRELEQLLPSG
jgi:MGT family glycosyltransferase